MSCYLSCPFRRARRNTREFTHRRHRIRLRPLSQRAGIRVMPSSRGSEIWTQVPCRPILLQNRLHEIFSKIILKHDERNQRILSLNETERSVLESRPMMNSMTEYPSFVPSVLKGNISSDYQHKYYLVRQTPSLSCRLWRNWERSSQNWLFMAATWHFDMPHALSARFQRQALPIIFPPLPLRRFLKYRSFPQSRCAYF